MYRHGASRNAQPAAPVALDSSNQFIDGLVFSWVASDCITDEQFTQTLPSSESGVTRLPTMDGNGIFVATSAASSGINFPVLPFIGIDKYTIAVDSAPAASATRSHFYFSGTEAGSPFPQYAFCANTNSTGTGSSGKFALIEYDSTFKVQAESIAGMVDGQRHLFEAVRDGTTVRLFRDGIDVTGTLGTISGTHSTTTGNANIGGSVGASNRGGNYPIYMVQAWNLARTSTESAEYARNYWKTQQKAARYFYPASGGAAVLEGDATSTSTLTGALLTEIPLAGASISNSTATGALLSNVTLAGVAASVSVADGALDAHIKFDGAALSEAIATGALASGALLAGDAAGLASASASLTAQITLNGAAVAQALATADLTTAPNGLAGDAIVNPSASAALTTAIPLIGSAAALAVAQGGLITGIPLAGAAVAVSNVTGNLVIDITFTGAAFAQALASGALSTLIKLDAVALSVALATGALTASSGSWSGDVYQFTSGVTFGVSFTSGVTQCVEFA